MLLAAERDELLGVAALAAHTQEAFFQTPALQIRLELVLHVAGQRTTSPRPQFTELRIALLHGRPVTLPIIIAMTALCRMIILQSKDIDPVNILFEAGGILILAAAALVMSYKDKLSLEKLNLRREPDDRVD